MSHDDARAIRASIRQYAAGKSGKRTRSRARTTKPITDMGQSLACVSCGLEVVIDAGDMLPCSHCGGKIFVPFRMLPWSVALSENDRKMLKSYRISDK